MAQTTKRSHPEHVQFKLACARTIREWASLEGILWTHLAMFLGIQDQFRARIVWSSLPNLQARRKLLNRLAETYLDESALPKYCKMMKRASRLSHNRNLVAHAAGDYYADTGKVLFVSEVDSTEIGFDFGKREEFDLQNVINWPQDIINLHNDLMVYYPLFSSLIHTSAKMHRG